MKVACIFFLIIIIVCHDVRGFNSGRSFDGSQNIGQGDHEETISSKTGDISSRDNPEDSPEQANDFSLRLGFQFHSTGGSSDADESFENINLFRSILDHVSKGQFSQESLAHWFSQIQAGLSKGTISHESMTSFINVLRDKLAGTPFFDRCCLFG